MLNKKIVPNFESQTKQLAHQQNLLNFNFTAITSESSVPDCIKMLALDLQLNNYISTGDYFRRLSDNSVEELFTLTELVETKDFKQSSLASKKAELALTHLTLLGRLLCLAEGEGGITEDEMKDMVPVLCSIILTETLARTKGTVKLLRNNYSLLEVNRIIGIPLKRS